MRRVSTTVLRGGALVMLLAMLTAFPVYADEPSPFDPPQNRILPPIGLAASAEEPSLSDAPQARILPPGGAPSSLDPAPVRVSPPVGAASPAERNFFELFWMWLQVYSRIQPPVG